MNLARLFADLVERRPGLVVGMVDDQIPLATALAHAGAVAERLADEGVAPGSRVALVASSSTDFVVAWMGCVLAGVPVALVNPTYPVDLHHQMLSSFDPALVIGDAAVVQDLAAATAPWRSLALPVTRSRTALGAVSWPGLDADRLDVVSYMHTSGTTGVPKFCAQSHEYFRLLGQHMADALQLTENDRVLAPLPLFHINPLGYGVIGAFTAGADVLGIARFSARAFWPAVVENQVSALVLHAPPVEILKRATIATDATGHRVRTMFFADRAFQQTFGIPVSVSGYGSTEAAGVSHLRRWQLEEGLPEDVSRRGTTRPDVEWRLLDGEILVRERRPGALFSGYHTPGGLDPARDDDGWFRTGDLGRHAHDGDLVFLERAAESIRVKGEYVPIPHVEEAFGAISDLRDLALWKRSGDLVDDELVLHVVAEDLPLAQIRAVSATLPAFMRPTWLARHDELPRDAAAGKVQRRRLPGERGQDWLSL